MASWAAACNPSQDKSSSICSKCSNLRLIEAVLQGLMLREKLTYIYIYVNTKRNNNLHIQIYHVRFFLVENSSEVNKPFKMASAGVLFNHFLSQVVEGPQNRPKKVDRNSRFQVFSIFHHPPPKKKTLSTRDWNAARSGVSPKTSRLLGSFLVGRWAVGMLTIWTVSRWMCPQKGGSDIFTCFP